MSINKPVKQPIDFTRDLVQQVQQALAEDIGPGDLTAQLVDAQTQASATVVVREQAVLCGQQWFDEVFRQLDAETRIDWQANDGDVIEPGQTVCHVAGPARTLLTGERTALNFLQTLSGTATVARQYASAIGDRPVRILDTRKTIPGLRLAQKYAVQCGGCWNHRIGLFDAILIKENHIAVAGSIARVVQQARRINPSVMLEIEVETLEQLRQALDAGVDRVLLDNMMPDVIREAVTLTDGQAELEASGNITLDNIGSVAATGVDYISLGGLTKHARAIDYSMRIKIPH